MKINKIKYVILLPKQPGQVILAVRDTNVLLSMWELDIAK